MRLSLIQIMDRRKQLKLEQVASKLQLTRVSLKLTFDFLKMVQLPLIKSCKTHTQSHNFMMQLTN
jgi:hypothetical protein